MKKVKLPKNWGKILVDGKHVDFNTMQEIEVPNINKWNNPKPFRYKWHLMALSILLGIVAGMILITPKVLEVCQ